MRGKRGLGLLVAVLLGAAALAPAGLHAVDPNAYTTTTLWIPSLDGTLLHTHVYRPASLGPHDRTPVILTVTPYQVSGATPLDPQAAIAEPSYGPPGGLTELGRMFEKGYTFVEVTLRGYGASEGCADFAGPGEQADATAAVEWAASQPWSTGKVGMTGHSYEAQTGLMALANKAKGLAAVVASAAPTGYANIWENGIRNTGGGHLLPAFYVISDILPPSLRASSDELRHWLFGTAKALARNPHCNVDPIIGSIDGNPNGRYWRTHDLVAGAMQSAVPTMFTQGFFDFQVRPPGPFDVALPKPGPKKLFLGQWDHGIRDVDGDPFTHAVMAWFDRWLKGDTSADIDAFGPVEVQDSAHVTRRERSFPPPDAAAHAVPLLPGTYVDAPGNFSETDHAGVLKDTLGSSPIPLPGGYGTWTFTAPLPHPVRMSGFPRAELDLKPLIPLTRVVALVYDVGPDGAARFVSRGTSPVGRGGRVSFDLYPQDWVFAKGHRVGVLVSGSDTEWFEPGLTATPVRLTGGHLDLPVLACARTQFIGGMFEGLGVPPPFKVVADTIAGRTNSTAAPAAARTDEACHALISVP